MYTILVRFLPHEKIKKTELKAQFSPGRGGRGDALRKVACVQVFSQSRERLCLGPHDKWRTLVRFLPHEKIKKTELKAQFFSWQGWKESNPPLEFWRLSFYR